MVGSKNRSTRKTQRIREVVRGLCVTCSSAAAGLDVCAKRASEERVAREARRLAEEQREIAAAVRAVAAAMGSDERARARTCEGLRWEWLASTAAILDGAPDARLVQELVRVAHEATTSADEASSALGADVLVRIRAMEQATLRLGVAACAPMLPAPAV